MILFVDLEHNRLQNSPALWVESRATVKLCYHFG